MALLIKFSKFYSARPDFFTRPGFCLSLVKVSVWTVISGVVELTLTSKAKRTFAGKSFQIERVTYNSINYVTYLLQHSTLIPNSFDD